MERNTDLVVDRSVANAEQANSKPISSSTSAPLTRPPVVEGSPAATKPATARQKLTPEFFRAMNDSAMVDWLLITILDSRKTGQTPFEHIGDAVEREYELRKAGVFQELRNRLAARQAGADELLSLGLRSCAWNESAGCPPAADAQAEAERIDWAAAEAGAAYPMLMLWMDGTNRKDANYYHDHIETINRMRPILEKNVQLGDCVALDWLAASYGLYVEIAQYRQPLLSYRYRFALLHAPFASQRTKDSARKQVALAQAQIRPELLRVEEKLALELVQSSFQRDTPNCKTVRDEEFNFAQRNR